MSKFVRLIWFIFGLLLIISGIISFFNPVETLLVLAYTIGFLALFSGISGIVYFFTLKGVLGGSMLLLDGIISAICGIIILSHIVISAGFIPYMVAFFVIVRGVIGITTSIDLKKSGYSQWGFSLFSAILTLLSGIILTFNPLLGTLYTSIMIGICLILYGGMTLQLWFFYGKIFKH